MRLNKASLKMSQTAPWGQGQSATLPPCHGSQGSLICLRWHLRDCQQHVGACGVQRSCPFIINITRLPEEPCELGRSSGRLAPCQEAPGLRDKVT